MSFRSQNQLEPFSSHGQHIFVQYHCVKMQSLAFLARLHFSAEELLLYPRRQRPRRRPHAKC